MECPKISNKASLDCSPVNQSVYSFSEYNIYKDSEFYGRITSHDKEAKKISFTIYSKNRFLNGIKNYLTY